LDYLFSGHFLGVSPRIKGSVCFKFLAIFRSWCIPQVDLIGLLKPLFTFLIQHSEKDRVIAPEVYALGTVLIFVGVLIIVLAVLLLSALSVKKGKVKGGGAIIIGPVPLIFGTDKKSLKTVLLLSLTLTVLLVIAMVVYYLLLR
jgi:uncharacterized protein (TIGR00304 family)